MADAELIFYLIILILIVLFLRKKYLLGKIKQVNRDEIRLMMKNPDSLLLLDVRTDQERNASKINGSVHIPLHEIKSRINELEKYRNKQIICYCRTGNRSLSAASKLLKFGYNAANLKGGILSWH